MTRGSLQENIWQYFHTTAHLFALSLLLHLGSKCRKHKTDLLQSDSLLELIFKVKSSTGVNNRTGRAGSWDRSKQSEREGRRTLSSWAGRSSAIRLTRNPYTDFLLFAFPFSRCHSGPPELFCLLHLLPSHLTFPFNLTVSLLSQVAENSTQPVLFCLPLFFFICSITLNS